MTDKEAMAKELEELAKRFSEGWHEGIKIDASDIMLLSQAAEALAQPEPKTDKEAMAMALEALEYIDDGANNQGAHIGISWRCVSTKAKPAITALKKRLAQPAQRTWIGLTDEEREEIALEVSIDAVSITEAKLKEKNNA